MSNQAPRVNVLIANQNYAEYVVGAVNSALNQTYPNLAITLIDSNSSDNSRDVIYKTFFKGKMHEKIFPSQYETKRIMLQGKYKQDIPLTVIHLPEAKGPSFARNVGIEETINDTFAFAILDADDEMKPNKVERLAKEMLQLPNIIGAVYADYDTLNIQTGILQREYKEPFSRERIVNDCIVHSGSLVSAEALKSIKDNNGYYDNKLNVAEDWDLWIRLSSRYMIMHVPESLSLVRVTPKNTSNTVQKEIWNRCWTRVRAKLNGEQV